jgi:hypothetical protein
MDSATTFAGNPFKAGIGLFVFGGIATYLLVTDSVIGRIAIGVIGSTFKACFLLAGYKENGRKQKIF